MSDHNVFSTNPTRAELKALVIAAIEEQLLLPYPRMPEPHVLFAMRASDTKQSLFPVAWFLDYNKVAEPIPIPEYWEFKINCFLLLLEMLETEEEGTNYHVSA